MEDWPSVRDESLTSPNGGGGGIVTILYLFVLLRLLPALLPVPRGERRFFANSLCGFAGLGSSGIVEAQERTKVAPPWPPPGSWQASLQYLYVTPWRGYPRQGSYAWLHVRFAAPLPQRRRRFLWATAGYGWGDLSLKPDDNEEEYKPDTTTTMAALGMVSLLLDGDSKGVSLNATADLPSMDGAASNGQQFAKEKTNCLVQSRLSS